MSAFCNIQLVFQHEKVFRTEQFALSGFLCNMIHCILKKNYYYYFQERAAVEVGDCLSLITGTNCKQLKSVTFISQFEFYFFLKIIITDKWLWQKKNKTQ